MRGSGVRIPQSAPLFSSTYANSADANLFCGPLADPAEPFRNRAALTHPQRYVGAFSTPPNKVFGGKMAWLSTLGPASLIG
jgi:hypothetical protein